MTSVLTPTQSERSGIRVWGVREWWDENLAHGFLGREVDSSGKYRPWDNGIRELFGPMPLLLKQTHSTEIMNVDDLPRGGRRLEGEALAHADGWIVVRDDGARTTTDAIRSVGIQTADCVPVFVVSQDRKARSALHCGWRGIAGGIISSVLGTLKLRGFNPSDLEVAIGPSARGCCYEVGRDVLDLLQGSIPPPLAAVTAIAFRTGLETTFADLAEIVRLQCLALGVPSNQICAISECTICSKNFYSYRREKTLSGRQLSFLSINF